jgi:hypothetical protein
MRVAEAGQSPANCVVAASSAGAALRSAERKPSLAKNGAAVVVRRNT